MMEEHLVDHGLEHWLDLYVDCPYTERRIATPTFVGIGKLCVVYMTTADPCKSNSMRN